jgi:hypothetical protein
MPESPFLVTFQFRRVFLLTISCLFFLTGCGGSSSDDTVFLGEKIDINVALASNASTVSTSYDNQQSKVIDGDTSTSEYWSGNVTNDSVTVNFGRIRYLKEIRIYTNEPIFNAITPNRLIELSSNGTDWFTTAQANGGDISCLSLLPATNKITCTYASRQQARYLRFTTTKINLNAGLVNVYEMEAIGY